MREDGWESEERGRGWEKLSSVSSCIFSQHSSLWGGEEWREWHHFLPFPGAGERLPHVERGDPMKKIQKTWIQQTLKPQMSMDHIRLSSASCGCTDFVSAASGKHSPQKCIKSQKNSCKVVFFVSYDLRTLVYTFNKLLWLSAKNAIQGVESFVR